MTPRDRANIALTRTLGLISAENWGNAICDVEQAINAAVEEEREACAQIAIEKSDRVQSENQMGWGMRSIADSIATAIRERCNTYATENSTKHSTGG